MNRISCTFAGAAIAISMLAAQSVATAASDYFLKLEGLDGEPGQTIEVQSWSWGTSRAGTSRETQKDSVRNMKANEGAQSARNLNSSKSNAYREASPAERAANLNSSRSNVERTDASEDRTSNLNLSKSNVDRSVAPVAENGSIAIRLSGQRPACAIGQHFPKAQLDLKGQRWALSELVVADCRSDGMTLDYARAIAFPVEETVAKSKSNITNN